MRTSVVMDSRRISDQQRSAHGIGGFRLTPDPSAGLLPRSAPTPPGGSRPPTPTEWRAAEAELQDKTHMPFEPPSGQVPTERRRLTSSPAVGDMFRSYTGGMVQIAEVVARDDTTCFVFAPAGRPYALRRIGLTWHALPPSAAVPATGDTLIRREVSLTVAVVLGEAEIGGWAVSDSAGTVHHVLYSQANRWVSLGVVDVC
jgi:hypothetical protein